MGKIDIPTTDRDLQSVFGENLKRLVANEKSVSQLCRNLGINRSQFSRYLSGEALPRPILLQRICKYFGVDARILLEPLADQQGVETCNHLKALKLICGDALRPAAKSILPDGFYAQWTASLIWPGNVVFNMARIYTENGVRKIRVRIPDPLAKVDVNSIYPRPSYLIYGLIYQQGSGFAIIDNLPASQITSFTSYRVGYSIHPKIFPGIKMAGTGFSPNQLHSFGPCFLEQVPSKTSEILKTARTPYIRKFEDAPERVRWILSGIMDNHRAEQPY